MAGTAGKYGSFPKNNPATNAVNVRSQSTRSNNGTNPSNKHWRSSSAGSSYPPVPGSKSSSGSTGMRLTTERLNAGAKKRIGGKSVKGLAS